MVADTCTIVQGMGGESLHELACMRGKLKELMSTVLQRAGNDREHRDIPRERLLDLVVGIFSPTESDMVYLFD
jgi:hypothetical protein